MPRANTIHEEEVNHSERAGYGDLFPLAQGLIDSGFVAQEERPKPVFKLYTCECSPKIVFVFSDRLGIKPLCPDPRCKKPLKEIEEKDV